MPRTRTLWFYVLHKDGVLGKIDIELDGEEAAFTSTRIRDAIYECEKGWFGESGRGIGREELVLSKMSVILL